VAKICHRLRQAGCRRRQTFAPLAATPVIGWAKAPEIAKNRIWHTLCLYPFNSKNYASPIHNRVDRYHQNLSAPTMDLLPNTFGIHEQALRNRSQRVELLATNIANASTPRFKARDMDFKQALGMAQTEALKTTNSRHFDTAEAATSPGGLKYRIPFNASIDGNTVEMSVEQAQFGKASADYRASLMFIENRVSGIKRALRGE
jgi:flagellar basal-body rod protein FlgB